ncbi:MAG: hypothetical protein R3F49_08695 [Planctomycetota bacterium]
MRAQPFTLFATLCLCGSSAAALPVGAALAATLAPQDDDTTPLAAPEVALDAAQQLDATWLALGAPEALEALGVIRMRGQAQALTSDFNGPFEELYHPDGRAVQRIDFNGSDPVFFGVDGRVSWEAWSDQAVAKFDWHAAADWRRFFLHRHAAAPGRAVGRGEAVAPWRALYQDAAIGGRARVEGKDCVRLVLTPRAAREHGLAEIAERRKPEPDVLWIDEATHLPVRYEQEMLRPAEGEIRLKETFSDWREFEGVRFPMGRKLEVPGAGLMFTVESIEAHVEVASVAFELPPTLTMTLSESHPSAVRLIESTWQLVERPEAHAIALEVVATKADEEARLDGGKRELLALLAELGVSPTGELWAQQLRRSDEQVTFEVVAPVARPVKVPAEHAARARAFTTPGGMFATGAHRGARARLAESELRLDHYLRAQGLVPRGPLQVLLLLAPESVQDPADWHTILTQPVEPRSH